MNQTSKLSGVAFAAAAATLFIAGCASEGSSSPAKMADAGTVTVKCYGANSCKAKRTQDRRQQLQGPERLQGHGFPVDVREACIDRSARPEIEAIYRKLRSRRLPIFTSY